MSRAGDGRTPEGRKERRTDLQVLKMHPGFAVGEPRGRVAGVEFVAQPTEESRHGHQEIQACRRRGGEGKGHGSRKRKARRRTTRPALQLAREGSRILYR